VTDLEFSGPGGVFDATVTVPGDKSLSHRALMFAAMAEGDSIVSGVGPGNDIASTTAALRSLGVSIIGDKVRSPGVSGWQNPDAPIDCGNSGTTMRHLAGILSTSPLQVTLTGDPSLSRRPMARLIAPLEALGGIMMVSPDGTAPIIVGGATSVHGASIEIPVASAQVRTAFEYAALAADASSTVDSPAGFRDHTERWLAAIDRGHWSSTTAFTVDPGPLPPARYEIPGDPSSAAYLWAAAAIERGASITTPNISLNPGRLGFLQILDEMGAIVHAEVTGSTGGDPVGTVTVEGRELNGVSIGGDLVASSLDELPLVAVVAAFAEGITSVSDATELRAKESDRIDAVVTMLRALKGGIEPRDDGFDVVGTGFLEGGTIDTASDHRIAMAGAVAATKALDTVIITNAEVASVSWPNFYATLESLWS
jgi:3-phosphoshikimate 1-carboxyvinyltransferase